MGIFGPGEHFILTGTGFEETWRSFISSHSLNDFSLLLNKFLKKEEFRVSCENGPRQYNIAEEKIRRLMLTTDIYSIFHKNLKKSQKILIQMLFKITIKV